MSRIYGTGLWQRTRLAVLERDGYRCHWCGGRATQADHLKPLARGGAAFNPDNLRQGPVQVGGNLLLSQPGGCSQIPQSSAKSPTLNSRIATIRHNHSTLQQFDQS